MTIPTLHNNCKNTVIVVDVDNHYHHHQHSQIKLSSELCQICLSHSKRNCIVRFLFGSIRIIKKRRNDNTTIVGSKLLLLLLTSLLLLNQALVPTAHNTHSHNRHIVVDGAHIVVAFLKSPTSSSTTTTTIAAAMRYTSPLRQQLNKGRSQTPSTIDSNFQLIKSPSRSTIILSLNSETDSSSSSSLTYSNAELDDQTIVASAVDTLRKQQRGYGDNIYSRVKAFGKLLTFQTSKPKNSSYFFGPTNNKMQHYYQNVNPSQRIFQLADDSDIDEISNHLVAVAVAGSSMMRGRPAMAPNQRSPVRQSLTSKQRTNRRTRKINQSAKQQRGIDDGNNDETENLVFNSNASTRSFEQPAGDEREVWEALASLEKDMSLLDRMIGTKPQLSNLQLLLLGSAVLSTASSPLFLAGQLTEFIAPSMAAFTAAIGIAAEYRGRVAVADSKEVAAASLQCAAEAEGYVAAAERAKAITPLCVGIGATAATLSLLVPVLVDSVFAGSTNLQLTTEIYLLCPLIAVLASAVAGLAVQEVKSYCDTAIGIGNRRFARSGIVSRTWLSATEMIALKSKSSVKKWRSFSISVLPAPILGALCPGALPTKTIVVAALAAAGSAYYLARAEYIVARACDAVALKSRSAAVCDTYANQGARSAAILPFTSALSSLCAAATAAVVELPFVESLTGRFGTTGTMLEIITITIFPALSALFAAAASVSKARCEVDAEAAMQAASTIALPYNDTDDNDPIIRPLQAVRELIRLTIMNSVQEPVRRFFRGLNLRTRWRYIRRAMVRLQGR